MDNANVILEMPQEYKTAWLAALRSGKYEQGDQYLCTFVDEYGDHVGEIPSPNSVPQSFCCLGVLIDVVAGREALVDGSCSSHDGSVPSDKWYAEFGMKSFGKKYHDFNPTKSFYPAADGTRADATLTSMNDGFSYREDHTSPFITVAPKSFLEIADYIEANVKGIK